MRVPRIISDRLIRRKVAMESTPLDRFTVRIAHTVDCYEGAFRLVQSAYIAKGIESVLASTLRITPQHVLPEAYVLIAELRGQLVGTMTVTLDSPAGLPLEKDYPEALAPMRAMGRRLCEFGSLAIAERYRNQGVANLLNMAAFTIASQKLNADRIVLGVNPVAVDYYRAMYNAAPFGGPKGHAQLSAPVAGLTIDREGGYEFLCRAYPRRMPTGYLAADHFFGAPLPCIEMPEGSHAELTRWKLSREVFQELFLRRSNRIETLDENTREHLGHMRSPHTVSGYKPSHLVLAELKRHG